MLPVLKMYFVKTEPVVHMRSIEELCQKFPKIKGN